jgi:hypothetical protein
MVVKDMPPPSPDPSTMDVPTMLSTMAEAGYRYNSSRCGTGLTAVSNAYKKFLAYREKQSEGLAAHSPSKEKETEKVDASEKDEEIACGRYVFMLFTFCVGVINIIVLGSQLRKRVTVVPKTLYVMKTAVCSMLLLLISLLYLSLSKKKPVVPPAKKPKANVVGKKIAGYVHIVTCGKVINMSISENSIKLVSQHVTPEPPLVHRMGKQKKLWITMRIPMHPCM